MRIILMLTMLCLLFSVQAASAIVSPDDPRLAHSENSYVRQQDGHVEKMKNNADSRDDAKAAPENEQGEIKPQKQEHSPE